MGLLPLLRLRDYGSLFRNRWSVLRTGAVVGATLLGIWILVATPLHFLTEGMGAPDLPTDSPEPTDSPAPPAPEAPSTMTVQVILALGSQYGLAAQVAFLVVFAPAFEEIVFRGVLLSAFQRHISAGWANATQACLFMLAHESLADYPTYFAIGWSAGLLARRSGGLVAPILLHAANNAVALYVIRNGL